MKQREESQKYAVSKEITAFWCWNACPRITKSNPETASLHIIILQNCCLCSFLLHLHIFFTSTHTRLLHPDIRDLPFKMEQANKRSEILGVSHNQSPVRLAVSGSVISFSQKPQETLGCEAICIRYQCEASCLFLSTNTWHRFLLCFDISLGVMVGQMGGDHVEVLCAPSATRVTYQQRRKDEFRTSEFL